MIVTAIKKNKTNEKYSVFVDYEFAFSLSQSDIEYFKIKQNEPIEERTYSIISRELVLIDAQNTAVTFLKSGFKTEKALLERLKKREFSDEIINEVVDSLKSYGYINDLEYAKAFIDDRLRLNPKSEYLLKIELRQKGIKDDIIEEAMNSFTVDESVNIKQLLIKKRVDPNSLSEKEKTRIIGFLTRRGYTYDKINYTLKHFNDIEQGD